MAGVIHFANLGRGPDFQSFMDQLHRGHTIRIRVYVMDATENFERSADISEFITSGQVDVDTGDDPDRMLTVTIVDQNHKIAISDPASSSKGGLWIGSIIQAWYDVYVDDLDAWVETPVFTGPVDALSRTAGEVTITAKGKEAFLVPPSAYNNIFTKARVNALSHSRRHAVMALLDAIGEPQDLQWEGDTGTLSRHFDPTKSFHKGGDNYLKLIRQMVGGNHQFWYDGQGRPRVRPSKSKATADLKGLELTEASSTFDMSEVRNRARTRIQKKPAQKDAQPPRPILVTSTRPKNDPLSAQSLRRNGVPRFLDADEDSSDYKAEAAAKKAGLAALDGYSEDVNVDIVPVPFLEPGDTVAVQVAGPDSDTLRFKVKRYSLPLHAGDSMSLGYTRKILDPKHARTRKHRLKRKHSR